MPVYLSTAVLGNSKNLVTVGNSGEIMAWFYPHKDHAQHIHQCLPCVYMGEPGNGALHWCWGTEWSKNQRYVGDTNAVETTLDGLGLHIRFTDVMPDDLPVILREIRVENRSDSPQKAGIYLFGDFNLGGIRQGNGVVFSRGSQILTQNHREAALSIGGDAVEQWQCGKAGAEWGNNARYALENGHLWCQDLEIGDVNWAFGFGIDLAPAESATKTAILALGSGVEAAIGNLKAARAQSFATHFAARQKSDAEWLARGLKTLQNALVGSANESENFSNESEKLSNESEKFSNESEKFSNGPENFSNGPEKFSNGPEKFSNGAEKLFFGPVEKVFGLAEGANEREIPAAELAEGASELEEGVGGAENLFDGAVGEPGGAVLPLDLLAHYKRSLLCLPLLNGEEGVAVAAPEFDPEFISCGGYGYTWPRDGGEYISGLLDAGYGEVAAPFFDWCARHQAGDGLWHQRYFLNGEPAPNWCLPPEMLQVDQVGAVLWAFGKVLDVRPDFPSATNHREMIRKAADYLVSRQDETTGVHRNAFDTWETFVGSFSYSNAAIYAAFLTAARVLGEKKYEIAAQKMKAGVLKHFVRDAGDFKYLVRGFKADGSPDEVVDSASLGAIEPFGLLDLDVTEELALAEGTLRAIIERLETDWEGGKAIRRFEGDVYVGGVPACVNTLWMARCCLEIAAKIRETGRADEAAELTARAQGYLQTVLRRATPTGLLPELMQGPTGQKYWAAPHGWAMSSFVSGVLKLAGQLGN